MKYIKKQLAAWVEISVTEKPILTLEGVVLCRRGDAIMTGIAGEHWPIDRTQFERSHVAVPPSVMGHSGLYVKRPVEVEAIQTSRSAHVTLAGDHGVLTANSGDWIVTDPNGNEWIVNGEIFAATYKPVMVK